jgi:hypothetical protein
MSMSPEELEALMAEPGDTSATTTTTTTTAAESEADRRARFIYFVMMFGAAFERYARAHGLNVIPFPQRAAQPPAA